jgi:hypothetical protein
MMSAAEEVPSGQLREGVETRAVAKRSVVGMALSVLGIACALVGPFLLDGISLVLLGIILGGLGYYFGLQKADGLGQSVGILAVALCVISLFVSALTIAPQ